MNNKENIKQIYISLLDENVDVWRPIQAECLQEGVYRILEQNYEKDIEKWEFEPGEIVVCKYIDTEDGRILAATERYNPN